jgi:hypothetical protein
MEEDDAMVAAGDVIEEEAGGWELPRGAFFFCTDCHVSIYINAAGVVSTAGGHPPTRSKGGVFLLSLFFLWAPSRAHTRF